MAWCFSKTFRATVRPALLALLDLPEIQWIRLSSTRIHKTSAILTCKQDNLISTPGYGTVLFNNGMLRRLISGTWLTFTFDAEDNIISTTTGGGAGGIDPTIATFTTSHNNLKNDTICGGTLTVSNNLGCGTFVSGGSASIQGGLHVAGVIPNGHEGIGGCHLGLITTTGMAVCCLTAVTNSISMLLFSHAGVSSPTSRIISNPNNNTLSFQIANSNRLQVGPDDVIVSAKLQVPGDSC